MRKIRDLMHSVYSKISDSDWRWLIAVRVISLNFLILIMFLISFCILGYEETFQHTARIHLDLIDEFRLRTRFVNYLDATSLFIKLDLNFIKFNVYLLYQFEYHPLECLCLLFLFYYILNFLYDDKKK